MTMKIRHRNSEMLYLATIHGYPDSLSVCEEVAAPYNKDGSMSVIGGEYYCEELR
jgi:hypothetical protein